ncbi:MAG: hypothetical protein H0Z29_03475 [Candidatus Marinimicrobia bacterium]|nr:hypothetical protein [Candidatus Neomarinimicrobiota bacterium]
MDNINLCVITSNEYLRKLVKYSIEDIEADIKIYNGISEIEKNNQEFFIIVIENSLINQQLKQFILSLENRFVIITYDITQVLDVKELFDQGIADFFIMEPIRSELVAVAIKVATRYFKMRRELKSKDSQISNLKKEKENLEKEVKKLIPSTDIKRNIPGEIYKKVGADRETLSRAYDIKDEEEPK